MTAPQAAPVAIEAVLFDYSGVLTTGLHMPTEDVPYDPDALFGEMVKVLSTAEANPWHELERGEISLDAYMAHVESLVPGGSVLFGADSEFNVMGNLTILEDRIALARELQSKGIRVGLVTNNVAEWRELWMPRLPQDLFEIMIDSAEVGHRKPEPAIYELAMQQMGIIDPATVLFVDDFEWNVAGAIAVGMAGMHCTPGCDLPAEVMAALRT